MSPCDNCSSFDFSCTGNCKPFGVKLRVKKYNPAYLDHLIAESRRIVNAMTPEQKSEMIRKQGEGWARSEAQWAKDFREGKCDRD